MPVHVVGNVCIDTTFRLDRFPAPGETLNAASHVEGLGGKGGNQAVAAGRTGAAVSLWAAIGRDEAGDRIRSLIDGEILHARLTALDLPSDRSTVMVDAHGENMIISSVACALAFDPMGQTLLTGHVAPGDIVVLQGNLTPVTTVACLRMARARRALTVLNASPIQAGDAIDLAAADIVIVNAGEGQSLTGATSPHEAARRLIAQGARAAVVTLGAEGGLLLPGHDAAPILVPAPTVKAVDTSGAGDVLCGVLAGCLAQGLAPADALGVAIQASAQAVTQAGTIAACPSAAYISHLLKTA
jgi:ribokinase